MGQQASTGLTTFYQFWAYVVPLLGGYIADAHLGRYNTIVIAVVIALVGHVLLIIAAVPGVIEHSQGSSAAFILGMIVTGFGNTHRLSSSYFVIDQVGIFRDGTVQSQYLATRG